MNFLHQVKSSIYDPGFYSELGGKPLGKSFRYYFELVSVVALLSTIAFTIIILPKAQSFLGTFGESIVSEFPADLEITLKDGKVATNTDEPYLVPIPEKLRDSEELSAYENMLVINTKEGFDLEKFRSYKTITLITSDLIVFENGDGGVSVESLSSAPNMVINRASVSDWTNKTAPLVKALPFVLPVLVFLAIFMAYVFNLIYVAIISVVVMLLLKLKRVETSYKKSYQVVLHAITLPILVTFLFTVMGVGSLFLFPTVMLLVVVLINFKTPTQQVVAQ